MPREIGRPLDHFGWFAFIFVNIDADGRRAREDAAGYRVERTGRTCDRSWTAWRPPVRPSR